MILLDFAFCPSPTLAFSGILGFFACDASCVEAGDASGDAARFFEPFACFEAGAEAGVAVVDNRYWVSSTFVSTSCQYVMFITMEDI